MLVVVPSLRDDEILEFSFGVITPRGSEIIMCVMKLGRAIVPVTVAKQDIARSLRRWYRTEEERWTAAAEGHQVVTSLYRRARSAMRPGENPALAQKSVATPQAIPCEPYKRL